MKKQDFVKAVRQGGAKFRADNMVITTDAGQLQGKGLLEVADGRFKPHVTLTRAAKLLKCRREYGFNVNSGMFKARSKMRSALACAACRTMFPELHPWSAIQIIARFHGGSH